MTLPGYVELHCRSNFSFLTAASHPEELVRRAQALGYGALAITDEGSLAGVVRAHLEARACGLHLIIGAEVLLHTAAGEPHARLVLLAQSRRGYGNLAEFISTTRRRAEKGTYRALTGDLEGKTPGVPYLAGLPDCVALLIPDAALPFQAQFAHAMWLKTWFAERAWLAVELLHQPGDDTQVAHITQIAELTGLPIVAAGAVLMHARSRKPLLDVLTATRLGRPVADCGYALTPNAEAHLRSRGRLAALYRPEWLAATLQIAAQCAFSLEQLRYEYPEEIVPAGHTPASWLRELAWRGAREVRYPQGVPASVEKLIEHELALIAQLSYEPFFLTVHDIVVFARSQNILCQGRGSAANSVVCYCLGITEVDPARMSVLFERFISRERNEPPDIDVDFEHQRREEVIQYLYRKYGRHRAALTATVVSYRPRSALRDVGKALGVDLDRIEALAKSQHWFDGRQINRERLQEQGFDPDSLVVRLWVELAQQLMGFPRHLSQHTGGFVIARDNLARLVPIENASMPDRSVIEWDKDDLDALGLLKVDVLALGMLSAIRRSLDLIGAKLGQTMRMQDVPAEDPATYDMICAADTVGVFQIESRAQMSMLPRLQPRVFYDLVIEVAIVRPGPIQGGMVHPYLQRRSGQEPVDYPSDEVRQALERTCGVPIFQEQVMQLAVLAADFTPGEADALRRAMAAWKRKGGLGPFHERLVGRMVQKGYSQDYAERIFKQIEGFGEYGFPESHAASFALLVYISCWIKRHHPDAFLAALLNSQPMGFYAPAQLVRDAREHGVEVRPVDVCVSEWECTLENLVAHSDSPHPKRTKKPPLAGMRAGFGQAPLAADRIRAPCEARGGQGWGVLGPTGGPQARPVRLGLNRVAGLSEAAALRICAARKQAPFASAEDLARRAQLDAGELKALAAADALQALAGHRHQAAWAVAGIDTRPTELLRHTRLHEPALTLPAPTLGQQVLADYRAMGLSLNQHPLALLRQRLQQHSIQPANVLASYPNGRLARASGLVTHRQRPETAKGVVFVTLEDETGQVNVIVWPAVADSQRIPLLNAKLLTVYGTWQKEGQVTHLIAQRLVDHTELLGGLAARSRDFR